MVRRKLRYFVVVVTLLFVRREFRRNSRLHKRRQNMRNALVERRFGPEFFLFIWKYVFNYHADETSCLICVWNTLNAGAASDHDGSYK